MTHDSLADAAPPDPAGGMTTGANRVTVRPARDEDLPACAGLWRDALNGYLGRLNQPPIGEELAPIGRLHRHVRATDPERFWVAERDGRLVGFTSAVVREGVWFLSMLFIHPDEQARGLGRALLARILPSPDEDLVLATATDSAQPVSNALYSTFGIVPRMPLLGLVGYADRLGDGEDLPAAVSATPFDAIEATALATAVDAVDREVAGFAHPADHAFLRAERRAGFLYRAGDGRVLGYGYASEVGRLGPVAVRDEALLGPAIVHLLRTIPARGASAVWVPGAADRAVRTLLGSGLRIDGFPVLLCWTRPFADFGRYLPISPGLL